MKRRLFIVLITIAMISCEMMHTKPIAYISYTNVEKAIISANPKMLDIKETDKTRVIPLKNLKKILDKVNDSSNAGEITFIPRYKLEVYLKDGSSRTFDLVGDLIKEKGDKEAQEIRISNYTDKIWELGEKE